jgi:protein AaeX
MIAEIPLAGVFVPMAALTAALAFVLQVAVHALARRVGLYRLVWHPGLFDLAVFLILWGAVSALSLDLPAGWLTGF